MIHVNPNHSNLNQLIPADSKNIGSFHNLDNIYAILNILALPVHYPVHASSIFTYGIASDPPSPRHDSLAENVTPKVNHKLREDTSNPLPNVPADPDSDPGLSYSSMSNSYDSSDDEYYK